jgi:lysophospholipase L1-like esterase
MLPHGMSSRMLSWTVPAAAGATSAGVLAAGLVLALSGRFGQPLGPAPAAQETAPTLAAHGEVRIVALGDSITAGSGDGRAGGYPARLAELLRARGRQAVVVNLAVPGAETTDVLRRIDSDARARGEIARADLLVVSASGNDLSHALRAPPDRPIVAVEAALGPASANLAALARGLRTLQPTAPIRFIGLYNPFDVMPVEEADARATLAQWNDAMERAAAAVHGVLVVPVADLFYEHPDRLARDHFHPGPTGHELIAARVLETLPDSIAAPR